MATTLMVILILVAGLLCIGGMGWYVLSKMGATDELPKNQ